jgi:Polyketide cyclase / dehydrase and lipid transport
MMTTTVSVDTIYDCTLERAFKTPMLCDVSKVHTGFGLMPRVTHCEADEHWGKPGFSKQVFVARSLTQKGGWASMDTVLERVENKYWKIEVSDFQSWMLGFSKFVGEWETTELEPNKILVHYTYTLHSDVPLLYPVNWLFANTFWRIYMKQVLENIRKMAYSEEPYQYE